MLLSICAKLVDRSYDGGDQTDHSGHVYRGINGVSDMLVHPMASSRRISSNDSIVGAGALLGLPIVVRRLRTSRYPFFGLSSTGSQDTDPRTPYWLGQLAGRFWDDRSRRPTQQPVAQHDEYDEPPRPPHSASPQPTAHPLAPPVGRGRSSAFPRPLLLSALRPREGGKAIPSAAAPFCSLHPRPGARMMSASVMAGAMPQRDSSNAAGGGGSKSTVAK